MKNVSVSSQITISYPRTCRFPSEQWHGLQTIEGYISFLLFNSL